MNIGQGYMNWLFDSNKITTLKEDEYEKEGTLYCKSVMESDLR